MATFGLSLRGLICTGQSVGLTLLLSLGAIAASPTIVPPPALPQQHAGVEIDSAPAAAPAKTEQAPPSLFDDPSKTQQIANLTVRMQVAHVSTARSVDTMSIHPYPMRPPVAKGPPTRLAVDEKTLKNLLLQTGYAQRSNPEKVYPIGGWRWQYAFQEAVRKSGNPVPHTLFGAYQWAAAVQPYAARETKRWNDFEVERFQRYKKVAEEFEKSRVETESDAVRQGLYPIDLRVRRDGTAIARIPAGNWWLTCTRKAPGMTFYWQVPFTAGGGENVNLTLTQPNALIVTGGW